MSDLFSFQSMISIVNAILTDAATYHCALFQDSNVGEFQSSMIQVGCEYDIIFGEAQITDRVEYWSCDGIVK